MGNIALDVSAQPMLVIIVILYDLLEYILKIKLYTCVFSLLYTSKNYCPKLKICNLEQ